MKREEIKREEKKKNKKRREKRREEKRGSLTYFIESSDAFIFENSLYTIDHTHGTFI